MKKGDKLLSNGVFIVVSFALVAILIVVVLVQRLYQHPLLSKSDVEQDNLENRMDLREEVPANDTDSSEERS